MHTHTPHTTHHTHTPHTDGRLSGDCGGYGKNPNPTLKPKYKTPHYMPCNRAPVPPHTHTSSQSTCPALHLSGCLLLWHGLGSLPQTPPPYTHTHTHAHKHTHTHTHTHTHAYTHTHA